MRVAGCTAETLRCYGWWLRRVVAGMLKVTPFGVRTFFVELQHLGASRAPHRCRFRPRPRRRLGHLGWHGRQR